MRAVSAIFMIAMSLGFSTLALACPSGTLSCVSWCKKYRHDAAGYQSCMFTHPTESCRVLGRSYCAKDRWHF
jgi:hypothetical protein